MEEGAAITIEIHRPELEALIRERMKSGGSQNPGDALLQALQSSPPTTAKESAPSDEMAAPTGADLAAQGHQPGTNTQPQAAVLAASGSEGAVCT